MLRALTNLVSDLVDRLWRRRLQPDALAGLRAEASERWRTAGMVGLLLWWPAARGGTQDYRLWRRLFGRPAAGDLSALSRVTVVIPVGSEAQGGLGLSGLDTTLTTLTASPTATGVVGSVLLVPLLPSARRALVAWLRSQPTRSADAVTRRSGRLAIGSLETVSTKADDWIVVIPPGARLVTGGLARMGGLLQGPAELVYADDDVLGLDGQPTAPHFKPDWDPILLSSAAYTGPVVAARRRLLPQAQLEPTHAPAPPPLAWGDLIAREAARRGLTADQVLHVPEVLAHLPARFERSRVSPATASPVPAAPAAGPGPEQDSVVEVPDTEPGLASTAVAAMNAAADMPVVSVVIPTRDRPDLLTRAMSGLVERTDYPHLEVIVVDNGSKDPEALRVLSTLEKPALAIRQAGAFNFAALCNAGVAAASGSLVLLMNDDVEPRKPGWLLALVYALADKRVAAVGPKLLYPDGRIQHGGIVLGIGGGAGHAHKGLPGDAAGYMGRARSKQRVSAVTGACMLLDRTAYDAVGGMDAEAFPVSFNDVDLCLRLGSRGWHVVYCPEAELVHHESASRGTDLVGPAQARFEAEKQRLRDRWGPLLDDDPFYNPNLSLEREDFSLAWPPRQRDPTVLRHPDVRQGR